MSSEQQLIKILWNNELRLIPCNNNNFQELIQQCSTRFELPASHLVLSYQDPDTDTITVTTDTELEAALSTFSQSGMRPKFTLIKKETPSVVAPSLPVPFPFARHHLVFRPPRQPQPQQTHQPNTPQPQKVQPKTEAEKKTEKQQKKQALRIQKLSDLKSTRIVRLRWQEPSSSSSSSAEEQTLQKKKQKNFKGCYFGVHWKNRVLNFECGRGLKSLWFVRQTKEGDLVLSSMVCPNRFLRMDKTGKMEFNTGENGPWARWNLINTETGEKFNKVGGNISEILINGSKVRLASKSVVGKSLGKQNKKEGEGEEAVGSAEGLTFTLEVVEALKAHQIVKLCCDGVKLIDPKVEDKEKKEKKEKKGENKKEQTTKDKKEENKKGNKQQQPLQQKKGPRQITLVKVEKK